MEPAELEEWREDFEAFHARFASVFHRREPREQCGKYLRGLMAHVERKNGWQLAEAMGDKTPDRTQRLLHQDRWEADEARDTLQTLVKETFGDEEGIGVVDESGFLKKGKHSVGVQRQYCGTAGKAENCQIGTFLCYNTRRGHVFLDRWLYLPQEWSADATRRAQAKVPEEVSFYLAYAPPDASLLTLAQVAASRYTVESSALRRPRARPAWMNTKRATGTAGIGISPCP